MPAGEICIIVPCYNEQENIKNVIDDYNHIKEYGNNTSLIKQCSHSSTPYISELRHQRDNGQFGNTK